MCSRRVFLITEDSEYEIGTVDMVLDSGEEDEVSSRVIGVRAEICQAIRDVVGELEFGDGCEDQQTITIELR